MSSNLAISARGVGKCYRRGKRGAHTDSIRDVFQGAVDAVLKGGKAAPRTEEFWALKDVSFDVGHGENVGIIGLNGAGKSTLLKVLSRITTPTTGTARLEGRMGTLLEVGTGFHQELTGRENAFLYGSILGMSREEVARKFDAIVDFSEIGEFIDTPVKRYSSGMYVRLAFAVAAHLDPDILLLDEVLAVGDFTFQRKCMDFARQLEKRGSTILFVSHNMFSIKTMCPRVIYLKKGQVVFDGPTEAGLKAYEADSRLAPAPWFLGEASPDLVITEAALLNEAGAETGVFAYGERMRVRLKYFAKAPMRRPDFRVGIDRGDDVFCCVYSMGADKFDAGVIEGEGEIELLTPALELASDAYNVNLVVRDGAHGQIVCAQVGGSFHIKHELFQSSAFGVFHKTGQWRHTPLSAVNEEVRRGVV